MTLEGTLALAAAVLIGLAIVVIYGRGRTTLPPLPPWPTDDTQPLAGAQISPQPAHSREERVTRTRPISSGAVTFPRSSGDGYFPQRIVGESHYQDALGHVSEAHDVGSEFTVRLVAEPTNPHDHLAVAVRWEDETLGYLPRHEAARYQQLVLQLEAKGNAAMAAAKLIGGGPAESLGVVLDIAPPTIAAEKLRLTYTRVSK